MQRQPNRAASPGEGATTVASPDPFWISIQIDPAYEELLDAEHLHRLACYVLETEGQTGSVELGITVTSDAEIHTLNKQYLAHDYATDVLSFGAAGPAPALGRVSPSAGEDEEGVEQDVVPASEYVTEGYEGDEIPDGAALPPVEPDAAGASEGTDSDSAQASAVQFVTPPGWPSYLGDIVISYETAAAQAADYGHTPAVEVDVLLIHGLLHLFGYSDETPAERTRMHARQDALLAAFS